MDARLVLRECVGMTPKNKDYGCSFLAEFLPKARKVIPSAPARKVYPKSPHLNHRVIAHGITP